MTLYRIKAMLKSLSIAVLLAAASGVFGGATARADESSNRFEDRPGVGTPVRFLAENGGAFRPDRLVIAAPDGVLVADLPRATNNARSEDRIDLSRVPRLGALFRDRLAPGDARAGALIGPVYRQGTALYLRTDQNVDTLTSRTMVLTSRLPRDGTVSFRFRQMRYSPTDPVSAPGPQIGRAYLLKGQLVIASNAVGEPPSLLDLLRF